MIHLMLLWMEIKKRVFEERAYTFDTENLRQAMIGLPQLKSLSCNCHMFFRLFQATLQTSFLQIMDKLS
jgi:hypothetical protein